MDIAIIGAGMAGLTCGARLTGAGHSVQIFDKGRGPGGRMSTRRVELGDETLQFDHGAQYFTVRDERFANQVKAWEAEGVAAPWSDANEQAWVGTPAMNAPVKAMARRADVQFACRINGMRAVGTGLRLLGDDVPGKCFDAVISAVPAEQVPALLFPHAPEIAELAQVTISDPCWTVMVAFDERPNLPVTIHKAGAIGWAARNSSKPNRGEGECWVVQASPEWSREYLEESRASVITLLLHELGEQAGGDLPTVRHASAHRWRYAMSGNARQGCMWNAQSRIGACGDWLHGPRVESAFLSGWELAQRIIDSA